ncbi:hypothetical protein CCP3SC5AM1_3010001 [Gammaproteobacteria bacterium]
MLKKSFIFVVGAFFIDIMGALPVLAENSLLGADPYYATTTATSMKTLVVDNNYYHLGDNVKPSFINPNPEGIKYEKKITVPSYVTSSSVAFVQFTETDVFSANLIINGKIISLPRNELPSGEVNLVNPYDVKIISVPAGFFISGSNTIGFVVTQQVNGNYDDIEIGKIVIYFQ